MTHIQDQWFSTFFDLRHPPLVIEQWGGGTPRYNSLVSKCQLKELPGPLDIFRALRLRTTVLEPFL